MLDPRWQPLVDQFPGTVLSLGITSGSRVPSVPVMMSRPALCNQPRHQPRLDARLRWTACAARDIPPTSASYANRVASTARQLDIFCEVAYDQANDLTNSSMQCMPLPPAGFPPAPPEYGLLPCMPHGQATPPLPATSDKDTTPRCQEHILSCCLCAEARHRLSCDARNVCCAADV